MIRIELPLSQEVAKACVIAAQGLGVEPWEIAVHALAFKRRHDERRVSQQEPAE